MTPTKLVAFEAEVAAAFEARKIHAPIHLSGGNEEQLIQIFKEIRPEDWVFSTWRSHYHALLHGVPPAEVMNQILAGRSMNLCFPAHRFYTSAIVGGTCPIAVGVAAALARARSTARVWVFVGDMTAEGGAFHEAASYVKGHGLPLTFVIESNGMSTNTPTWEAWGEGSLRLVLKSYLYTRTYPHTGVGKWITF